MERDVAVLLFEVTNCADVWRIYYNGNLDTHVTQGMVKVVYVIFMNKRKGRCAPFLVHDLSEADAPKVIFTNLHEMEELLENNN